MADSTERLGELLKRMGALTEAEINIILTYQKGDPSLLFGQIAIKLGFITKEVLDQYL